METFPQPVSPTPASAPKSNTTIIIIIAVVLFCCCCLIVGVGLLVVGQTAFSSTFEDMERQLQPGDEPGIDPMPPVDNTNPGTDGPPADNLNPGGSLDGYIPTGGLGDETLRANTWVYVIMSAAFNSCEANDPASTVIEVLARPDSSGVWQERWAVACADGSTQAFDVTFTPSAQGGTDISVTTAP